MGKRRMGAIIAIVFAAALLPGWAAAFSAKAGESVTLPKGETHNGSYFVSGQNLAIEGDINGDLFCAGSNVTVSGTVRGDVICATQTIAISGHIEGNVRVAAQTITLTGQVDRNTSVMTQTLSLTGGRLGGELAALAQAVSVGAPVSRDLYGAMENLSINAPVSGRLDVATDGLTLGNDGRIGGDVNYTSDKVFKLDETKVDGKITRHTPPREERHEATFQESLRQWLAGRLFWTVGSVLLGLALVWLLPRLVRFVVNMMQRRPGPSLGWGALALVFGPGLVLLLALTLIGLPVAMVLGGLWLMAVLVAVTLAGIAAGRWFLERGTEMDRESLPIAALVGIPVVVFVTGIPVIGPLLSFLAVAWAMGAMLLSLRAVRK